MSNYSVMNILDFMDAIGEDSLRVVLSEFSCPKNLEIQEFMRKNAIEFAKKKTSITYFMVDEKYQIHGILRRFRLWVRNCLEMCEESYNDMRRKMKKQEK